MRIPNFDNEFILYTFASNHLIATMITQKNEEGEEFPISFMRSRLQGAKLNYPTINKQAFQLLKVMKHFQTHLLRSHTNIIVPHSTTISLVIQKELGDRQGNWLTRYKSMT